MAIGRLFVDFEARTAKFEEKTNRARRSMGAFGKSSFSASKRLGALQSAVRGMVGPFLALATAGGALASTFNNIRIKEKLDAQLKVATGSAEKADIAFADLSSTAGKMPNQLQEITQEFIRLRNLGLKSGERELISYGNTAAAMGKSLNQMIEAVADATTGEFERLKEFGIKSRSEGDRVTFTFQGVSTTVRKNAEEIENYLRRIGEVQFAGSMAEQMDTIDGKLSVLGDSWFQFTNALAEGGGFAAAAQAVLESPVAVLDAATLKLKESQLDLANASIADIPLIEALIEKGAKDRQAAIKNFNVAGAFGGKARQLELEAKLEELKIEKELAAEKDEAAALDERRAAGAEALAKWEDAQRRKQRGVLQTFAADHKALMGQIHVLQGEIRAGAAGNVDAAMKELEALQKQQEDLTESYERAKSEQDEARKALVRHGGEWMNMRRNMREAFAEGIAGGRKLGDVLEDVLSIWARSMAMNVLLGKVNPQSGARDGGLLDGIFGGSSGSGGILGGVGGILGGIFGRTSGGSVSAGQIYRFNEGAGQQEYFKPHVSGQVLPMAPAGAGGGSGDTYINIDARGADAGVAARLEDFARSLPSMIRNGALGAYREEQRRNGL